MNNHNDRKATTTKTIKDPGDMFANTGTHTQMYACTDAHMHMLTHTYIHAHMHACMHACTHTHAHTNTHICTHACTHARIRDSRNVLSLKQPGLFSVCR